MCCGGSCVDNAHDPANCGLCGNACPTGSACLFGACTLPDGGPVLGCEDDCPPGTACVGGAYCLLSTCTDADLGADCFLDGGIGSCCGTSCVDLETDPENCAFCFAACGAGETCSADNGCSGATCPPGALRFGGACLPTTCNPLSQGQFACAIDAGAFPDLGTCCGTACVNTLQDPANCQVCGNACPVGSFCNSGFCPVLSCAGVAVDTQCILSGGSVGSCCDGACVDTNSDLAACGGCGVACPLDASCQSGACFKPDGGFFECPEDPSACPPGTLCSGIICEAAGCAGAQDGQSCAFGAQVSEIGECCGGRCTDPATDPQNCGACGFGSSAGSCVNGKAYPPPPDAGVCSVCPADDECAGPYCVDPGCFLGGVCFTSTGAPAACCPSGASNSQACVDVENDPQNCGGCGIACPSGQTCSQGSCSGTTAACAGGVEGYCDLDAGPSFLCCPGGGCTDTRSDPHNCGGCGRVCDAGCAAGVCG